MCGGRTKGYCILMEYDCAQTIRILWDTNERSYVQSQHRVAFSKT